MRGRAIVNRILCIMLTACLIAPGLAVDAYANSTGYVENETEEKLLTDILTESEEQTEASVSENTASTEEVVDESVAESTDTIESEVPDSEGVQEDAGTLTEPEAEELPESEPEAEEVPETEMAITGESSEAEIADEDTGDESLEIDEMTPEYVEVDVDVDYGAMRYVTQDELAALMANASGQDTVRKKIVNQAKSMKGTFPLNYYSTLTKKDGTTYQQYRCKQCMSYVNHVWMAVFGKDMWSKGVSKDESQDGETIYEFLQRTGAKAGDILFTRYYKTKNNANYWSTHYMIVLGYDSKGVWITDGYQDSDTKKTVIWRIDKKSDYKDKKGNWGQYYRPDGSMSDKSGSRWKKTDNYGHFFRLYRVDNKTWSKVAGAELPEVLPAKPTLSNVKVSKDALKGTYTVTVDITAPGGLDRVQFPTWTEANGQDDLVSKWATNSAVSGKITTLGNDKYRASFVVKTADHNGEQGNYLTHIYAYDNYDQRTKIEAPITNMNVPPQIRSVSITKVNQNAGTYSIQVLVNKNVKLDRVQFPTWTEANGQDDLASNWKTNEDCSGRIYNQNNSFYDYCTVNYTVDITDHNNERGKYITHIYAYAENGAYTRYILSPVNFTTALSGTEENTDGTYSWALVGEEGAYELIIEGTDRIYEAPKSYPWNPYLEDIVKINIGEGIKQLGDNAFKDLKNLKEVTFPSTLLAIGKDAFRGCSSLPDTLYLPESMYRLSAGAFRNTPVRKVIFTGDKLADYSGSLGEMESEIVLSGSNVTYENNTGDWIISEKTWTSDNEYTYTKISTEGILYTFYIILAGAFDETAVFYYDPTNEAWADSGDTYLGYKLIPLSTTTTGLKLDDNDLSMIKGMTKKLTCTVEPADEVTGLVWSSEDEAVATVSNDGMVTAVAEGSTVISVATPDGSYKVSCNIMVGSEVTEIDFTQSDVSLVVGENDKLEVTLFPEVAPASDFIWSSDDEGVVTVDENGKVTAQRMGSTIVRACLKDNEEVVAACPVTVLPDIISLQLNTESVQLMPGEEHPLFYAINPSNRADAEVVWSSSDPSVVSVENGLVKATESLNGGEAVITVETADGAFKDTCTVTVVSQTVDDEAYVDADADTVQITGFVEEMTYTGQKLTQNVKVYCGRTLLTENEDYTIKYSNNVKAAAKTAKKAPKMTVTLMGAYKGTYTKTFTILPADITMDGVADSITVAYNKKAQKVVPTVLFNGKNLKNKTDFVVKYTDTGDYKTARENPYTITVTGKGNYTGTRTYQLYIVALKAMKDVTVTKIPNQKYNGGDEVRPHETIDSFTVKYKGEPVDPSQYTITYSNNTEVGSANMIITAKAGGEFTGEKVVSFTIKSLASLKKATVNENAWKSIISYTSEYGDEVRQDEDASLLVVKVDGVSRLLDKNYYDITYKNNTKAGKATVTFKGKNGFDGTYTKTFTIKPYNIETSAGEVTITAPAAVYLKNNAKTVPVVTYKGRELTAGVDYTLEYKNYKAVRKPTDKNPPTVIIKGKGKFKGKLTQTYEITKQDISLLNMTVKDVEYGKKYEVAPTITDLNGKKLKEGTDFSVSYYVSEELFDNDPDVGTVVYITVEGMNNYEGSISSSYSVIPKDIAKAKVSVKSQTYTGSAICPDMDQITVKVGGKKLTTDSYEIVGYTQNVKIGKGKVILRGKDNYGGTITVQFKIEPKKLIKWL